MHFSLGERSQALEFIRDAVAKPHVRRGRIVVAWAREAGVGLLYTAIKEQLRNVDLVVGMAGRGTSAEAIAQLRSIARRVYVYHKHHRQTFHPKVYLFDSGETLPAHATLLVGSSNLTAGGLVQNTEGNLMFKLSPASQHSDELLYLNITNQIDALIASPYCEEITTDNRIEDLLRDRYLSTEKELRRKRLSDDFSVGRRGTLRQKPEAPPPPIPEFSLPPLARTFHEPPINVPDQAIPIPADVSRLQATDAFYVRTLTKNDINKLRRQTPGTAEWDIGTTARDAMPSFWGWPDSYKLVTRQKERLEWESLGLLQSSVTGSTTKNVNILFWYREQRDGHAAEHRIRISPRATLTSSVPPDFDERSLVVIERLPVGQRATFLVKLIVSNDIEYKHFEAYLRHKRPKHKYGYGP